MNRLLLARAHAAELKEIIGSIYGLTTILEADACSEANDGEEAALGPFEQGVINTSIKHLAVSAEGLAEAIEDLHIPSDRNGGDL